MITWKKIGIITFAVIFGIFGAYYFVNSGSINNRDSKLTNIEESTAFENKDLNFINQDKEKIVDTKPSYEGLFAKRPISILLLGLDIGRERRARGQVGSNADTIMFLSIHPENKKAIFTSIPRDLWTGRSKINAVLNISGVEEMMRKTSDIVGMPVESYVMIDFDGIRWLIDYFGGVEVEVENSFSDASFPNNQDSNVTTVQFTKGIELMDGERALTFSRSRKGDNVEGSDLKRAKRQHQIFKGILGAVASPKSGREFNPTSFYNDVILNTKTNISLQDALYLFDFYQDHQKYTINSLVLDERYIFHPDDSSPYGGAWVFVSKDPNFETLKKDISEYLNSSQ